MTNTSGPSSDAPSLPASPRRPSRRTVLQGAAAGVGALAVGGLSGCGGGSTGGGTAGATTSTTSSGAATSAAASPSAAAGTSTGGSTPTPSASSSPAAPSGGGAASIVAAAEVPVGGGIVVGEQKIVVTQPTAGSFKAFSSTCTHQNCQVAGVRGGAINCACHNSNFSLEDGAPRSGPARTPLPSVPVRVDGGNVVRA